MCWGSVLATNQPDFSSISAKFLVFKDRLAVAASVSCVDSSPPVWSGLGPQPASWQKLNSAPSLASGWHRHPPPRLSASQGLHSEKELIPLINKTKLEAKIRGGNKEQEGSSLPSLYHQRGRLFLSFTTTAVQFCCQDQLPACISSTPGSFYLHSLLFKGVSPKTHLHACAKNTIMVHTAHKTGCSLDSSCSAVFMELCSQIQF